MAKSNSSAQKAKIWYDNPYWYSALPTGLRQHFLTYEGAAFSIESYFKRTIRWTKAEQIIFDLSLNLCSVQELGLIDKLQIEKRISKRQYGWLKGILERQRV